MLSNAPWSGGAGRTQETEYTGWGMHIIYLKIKLLTWFISADDLPWVLVPLSCSYTGGSLREQSIITFEGYLCTGNS